MFDVSLRSSQSILIPNKSIKPCSLAEVRIMRSQNMANLLKPFAQSEDPEIAFPQSVGIETPEVEVLYREIFRDLDEKVFGIGWWAPHPGTSRRILISNYLLECVRSIRTNLTEAALHLLEAGITGTRKVTSWRIVSQWIGTVSHL